MGGVTLREAPARDEEREASPPRIEDRNLRRYTLAALAGVLVGAVPFLWALLDMWTGSLNLLRHAGVGYIYDLQARALMHGHLAIPNGQIGLEAFVHDGHQYTYFGVLPSLIRMPALLLDPGLKGKLTTPSILIAWVIASTFAALLLWRIRIFLRGTATLGIGEATTLGALVATITGGSVLVFLGATPWVYHEDLMWSVALTLGALFALVGVLERPSTRRVVVLGVLVLLASLNRLSTSWACVAAIILVSGWFWLGRAGPDKRKWSVPLLVAGLVPFAASCAINVAKFGTPIGLPMVDQLWTAMNLHRRQFLAANGGKYYGLRFLPSDALAYLQPLGVRFRMIFPFVTMPAAPAHVVGGVIFDDTYRTASAPSTMPLLCLLTGVGAFAIFRRRSTVNSKALRLPLLAMTLPIAITLVWGYIATRFLADYVPLLALGACIGLVAVWQWLDHRRPALRRAAVTMVVVLTLFGLVANLGISMTPAEQWRQSQIFRYVKAQQAVGNAIGHPVTADVVRGNVLPYWAPADELFVVGDCKGLYISTGQTFQTVPKQEIQRTAWQPVGQVPDTGYSYTVTFHEEAAAALGHDGVTLLTVGNDTVVMKPAGKTGIRFGLSDKHYPAQGIIKHVKLGLPYTIWITVDVNRQSVHISIHGIAYLNGVLTSTGPATLYSPSSTSSETMPGVSIVPAGAASSQAQTALCHSLLKDS